ncbi:MAG TPA: methyltransferase domain-containing protein [Vicinamibacterales bacterium]|nr:methyltransferase domain-containing protein [Vicinamibacterales bacterium]
MTCCGARCEAAAQHFGAAVAERDRDRYQRHGLDKRGRFLLEGLAHAGLDGQSVLDIGSGVGAITFELLKRGARAATLADASSAYLDIAAQIAATLGLRDRIQIARGDFVDTAQSLEISDVVVLDRAVCCYRDAPTLLVTAASRCRRVLGLTYPRRRPHSRLLIAFENLRRRLSNNPFRAFVHDPALMESTLGKCGLRRVSRTGTFFWVVEVYRRDRSPADRR